jgi:hypothetical protein
MDPRLQAPPVAGLFSGLPQGTYFDPNFTTTQLTRASNRVLSFVDALTGNFNGNATVLAWPPIDPAAQLIDVTPEVTLMCSNLPAINLTPVAVDDTASAVAGTPVIIAVLANDRDANGDPLSVTGVTTDPAFGTATTDGVTVTYTPQLLTSGIQTFTYTVSDGLLSATGNVSVTVFADPPPAAPTGLTAALPAANRITLTWLDNASTETAYVVEVSTNGSAFAPLTVINRNAANSVATGGIVAYNDNTVTIGNTYSYQVKAQITRLGSTTPSAYAGPVSMSVAAPLAPTNVAASAGAVAGAVVVSWADASNNESGFRVERSLLNPAGTAWLAWGFVGTAAANQTTITDTGRITGRTYRYQVRANGFVGNSVFAGPSNSVVAP